MAETAFAKTFLSTLDARPIKIQPDHVEDAKTFPARPPFILPRMPKPMSTRVPQNKLPGQERSIDVLLKSLRNPPLDTRLPSQPLTTSVLDIKNHVSKQTGIPADKIKLLHKKRPVADSKIVKELVGDSETRLEFAVMVMGGGGAAPAAAAAAGKDALTTEAFWSDLRGFLMQRLKDEGAAEELALFFRSSWDSRRDGS